MTPPAPRLKVLTERTAELEWLFNIAGKVRKQLLAWAQHHGRPLMINSNAAAGRLP